MLMTLCFSKTVDEHISWLVEILNRIREAGLKLSPNKCKLFQQEVVFLGHIVSETGVSTDPEKVRAVKEWHVPRNDHELRSFLGTASYYQNFLNPSVTLRGHYTNSQKNKMHLSGLSSVTVHSIS